MAFELQSICAKGTAMLPFRKILFPVDYSDASRAIVPHVKEMARHFGSEITLLHAYPADRLGWIDLPLEDSELAERERVIETERLAAFAREMFPGQAVTVRAEPGDPGAVIHETVKREGIDLVMMPTRGRGPVRRLLLGSVTAKVLHDVGAAVWTGIGEAVAGADPRPAVRSVVCALGHGDEAEPVLAAAAAVAKSYGAALTLVHVVETPPLAWEIDYAPMRKTLMDAADVRLRELKARTGVTAPHAVLDGSIIGSLASWAAKHGADLIVAGRGGMQGPLRGVWSHLYDIVREAPCPVLSI
jgi:nucleotide-binding universal stress UspA family protein